MPDIISAFANVESWLPYPRLIISLAILSFALTALYIILSIRIIKQEREEKKQKMLTAEQQQREEECSCSDESPSSGSEKSRKRSKRAVAE